MVISNRFSYAWKASVWGGSGAHQICPSKHLQAWWNLDLVMDIVWSIS